MPCAVVRITLYLQYLILKCKALGTECPYAEIAVAHY